MSPFIRDGDVVTVSPCPRDTMGLGDVVAFVQPCSGRLAVHRVVGRGRDSWRIRGDNTPEADGWIGHDDILGRVTRVERAGKRVRLGLGPERVLIALFSRRGWLQPGLRRVRSVAR